MKHAVRFALVVLAIVFVGSGAIAQPANTVGNVQIDFKFVAAGKAMPAGNYTIQVMANNAVTLRSAAGDSATLPVITRLGRHDNDATIELVFDRIQKDGELLLSEVWPPAPADGYLMLATHDLHTHYIVGGSRPSPKM